MEDIGQQTTTQREKTRGSVSQTTFIITNFRLNLPQKK
jgi:hypothetical protein